MRDFAKKTSARAKKGGDRFVILFFVILAPAAALVFMATSAAIGTRDTLARFVPRTAAAYLHGGGTGAERILKISLDVPAGVSPREAAIFYAVEDDGRLHRGTLLGWSAARRPTTEEKQALSERGAAALGTLTYFIGDGPLESAARTAQSERRSIADDLELRRALGVMRGIATLQAYADPLALKGSSSYAELLGGLPPVVAGIAPTETLSRAVILPVRTAAAFFPFGFRAPSPRTGASLGAASPLAKTVISSSRPDFDALGLFLGISGGQTGQPGVIGADSAAASLPEPLDAPVQASLFPDPEKKTVLILLRYPTLSPDKVASSIERYVSVAWPERKAFLMPDEDQAVEYKINADRFHFAPLANAPVPGTMTLTLERPSLQLFLAADGHRGSLLAANVALLKDAAMARPKRSKECSGTTSREFIIMKTPATLLAVNPELRQTISSIKAEDIRVDFFVDNILFLCGYTE